MLNTNSAGKVQARLAGMHKELNATKAKVEELNLRLEQLLFDQARLNRLRQTERRGKSQRGRRDVHRENWRGKSYDYGRQQFDCNTNGSYPGWFAQRPEFSRAPQRSRTPYGHGRNYSSSAIPGEMPFKLVMTSDDAYVNATAPPAPVPTRRWTAPKYCQHKVVATVQTDNISQRDTRLFPGNKIYTRQSVGNRA